ncbi:MAG: LacI family DNA-binding transcriptional regulator [Fimbriimonas sp.]
MKSREGESPTPTRAVRLADIAQSLGIAVSTVSMAIAGDARIAEATRNAVKQKADELGFRPNPNAQRLLKGFNRGEIAVVMHDIDQGILTQIAREIRVALAAKGYRPTLHITDSPDGSTDGQASAVRTLRYEKPEAMICFLHHTAQDTLDELRRYRSEGGTLASYFNPIPLDCDQVIFDEEHGTRIAVEHLVSLGHRRIGFCTHGALDPESRRYKAFLQAMNAAGLPVPDEYLMPGGRYEAGGCEIAHRFMKLDAQPTALHIVNDAQVSGFVSEMYRLGFRVPQYVSVIGTDDIAAARSNWVPITTVSVPSDVISESVVNLLASRLRGEYDGPPRIETVRGALIERSTVGPPRPTVAVR